MEKYANLMTGDPAPWFYQRSFNNPNYAFDSAAGRYLVLCFFTSAADEKSQAALNAVFSRPDLFNDDKVSFFGVSCDPDDEAEKRLRDRYPGYRFFWDFDHKISKLYGATPVETDQESLRFLRRWVVLSPTLHVLKVIPFANDSSDIAQVLGCIEGLPPPDQYAGLPLQAPIIVLPDVFEPELCAQLIDLYETNGGIESGFMREVGGKTVSVSDHSHKRRRDHEIADRDLISFIQGRFLRRIIPEISKVHQFVATRMERYIVACYAAEDNAHFAPHRDNTTRGTAHRRFAVSVNLNEDFDGGEVGFPEYGARRFKAPAGGAVVFSCSLLHSVSRVTRGKRYAFLPFLYDDAAAKLRQENNAFLADDVRHYKTEEKPK